MEIEYEGGTIEDIHEHVPVKSIYQCIWSLKNFSARYLGIQKVSAPKFLTHGHLCTLQLLMSDVTDNDKIDAVVDKNSNQCVPDPNVDIEISILKADYEKTEENLFVMKSFKKGKSENLKICHILCIIPKNILMDPTSNILVDNELKIHCKIVVQDNVLKKKQKSGILHLNPIHSNNLEIADYFNNEKFSDLKFIIGNNGLYAHKLILAMKSPVFAAMLENDMRESRENVVTIEEIDFPIFQELIRYIYTGKALELKEIAADLIIVADRYQVTTLVEICSKILLDSLTLSNVLYRLQLADRLNLKEIKEKALEMIKTHARILSQRPEFEAIVDLHKDLLVEVFQEVSGVKKRRSEEEYYFSLT